MKILLVKRLESSFFAFRQSIGRFLNTYNIFLDTFHKGNVHTSKSHTSRVFDFLENNDDESIQQLIDEGKVDTFKSHDFRKEFIEDLEHDQKILMQIQELWKDIDRDPKLLTFIEELTSDPILKKIILSSSPNPKKQQVICLKILMNNLQERFYVLMEVLNR